jgi:hypothetical protein
MMCEVRCAVAVAVPELAWTVADELTTDLWIERSTFDDEESITILTTHPISFLLSSQQNVYHQQPRRQDS